jgi:hypothetical protein
MKLPNAEQAFVDVRKLRDYCFSTDHPRGQHKARVFKSVLGWTADQAEDVRRWLLEAVLREDAGFLGADDYGQRYALDFPVQGAGGLVMVGACGSFVTARIFHDSSLVMFFSKEQTS